MSTFSARWPGHCDACSNHFREGDEIGFVDDYPKPVCEDCYFDEGGEL